MKKYIGDALVKFCVLRLMFFIYLRMKCLQTWIM